NRISVVRDVNRKLKRQWRDYRTAAGGRPVKSFLDELTDEEVAAVVAGMKEIAAEGLRAAKRLRGDITKCAQMHRREASACYFRLKDDGARSSCRFRCSRSGRRERQHMRFGWRSGVWPIGDAGAPPCGKRRRLKTYDDGIILRAIALTLWR